MWVTACCSREVGIGLVAGGLPLRAWPSHGGGSGGRLQVFVILQEKMVDLSEEALLDYHEMVSKTFRSEEEGYGFYNRYAFDRGFSVRRCYVERDTTTKEICLRKFVCSRQGFRDAKHMNKAESDNGDVYIFESQTGTKKHKITSKNTSGTKKKKKTNQVNHLKCQISVDGQGKMHKKRLQQTRIEQTIGTSLLQLCIAKIAEFPFPASFT